MSDWDERRDIEAEGQRAASYHAKKRLDRAFNTPTSALQEIRQLKGEIDHLRAQLREAGIHPMGEFICACGMRKSAPVENEPKF